MTEYLRITNWERWQTYRKDRGKPAWIKVWRCLLRNPEWVTLSDAQRGQLVTMWLIAADHDGTIPDSPTVLKKLCHMDTEPDIQLFMSLGFINRDQVVTELEPSGNHLTGQFSTVQVSTDQNKTTGDAQESSVYRKVRCRDGAAVVYTDSVEQWKADFPTVDVPAAVAHACAWCEAQTGTKQWTTKGLKKALVSWLGREVERAKASEPAQPERPKLNLLPPRSQAVAHE